MISLITLPKSILIIEDDPEVAKGIRRDFIRGRWDADVCANREEFELVLRSGRLYGLALVDSSEFRYYGRDPVATRHMLGMVHQMAVRVGLMKADAYEQHDLDALSKPTGLPAFNKNDDRIHKAGYTLCAWDTLRWHNERTIRPVDGNVIVPHLTTVEGTTIEQLMGVEWLRSRGVEMSELRGEPYRFPSRPERR